VVLSDIVMEGGMSGLELAPLIAARRPGLPLLLMTGYSEALARGEVSAWPVLAKPFQQSQLIDALTSVRGGSAPVHTA
jgi:DNA-binding LytR/AlgR family response regulator